MSTETPETDRNVTAFFDTREAAEQAISQITETGLPRDKILLRTGAARRAAFVDDGKGLLQEVKELILPSEEPDAAVAALKHEGFLLSVRPEPDSHDAVFRLLEQAGGKGIESREDIWPDWKSGQDGSRDEEYPEGDTPESDTPQGDTPQGDTPQGDTPQGDTPQGDTPQGDTAEGSEPPRPADAPAAAQAPVERSEPAGTVRPP